MNWIQLQRVYMMPLAKAIACNLLYVWRNFCFLKNAPDITDTRTYSHFIFIRYLHLFLCSREPSVEHYMKPLQCTEGPKLTCGDFLRHGSKISRKCAWKNCFCKKLSQYIMKCQTDLSHIYGHFHEPWLDFPHESISILMAHSKCTQYVLDIEFFQLNSVRVCL